MTTKLPNPMEAFIGPSTEAFKMWVSFFPVAPAFGVEWRFAEIAARTNRMAVESLESAMTASAAAAAPGATPTEVAAHAGEAVEAMQETAVAMAEAATEMTGAVTEAVTEAVAETAAETAEAAELPAGTPTVAAAAAVHPAVVDPADAQMGEMAEDASEALDTALEANRPDLPAVAPATLFDAPPAEADDLKQIRGIGPGLEAQLNDLGIYRMSQIAELSRENLVWIDENLTAFKGRCFRDDWVGQARSLQG